MVFKIEIDCFVISKIYCYQKTQQIILTLKSTINRVGLKKTTQPVNNILFL